MCPKPSSCNPPQRPTTRATRPTTHLGPILNAKVHRRSQTTHTTPRVTGSRWRRGCRLERLRVLHVRQHIYLLRMLNTSLLLLLLLLLIKYVTRILRMRDHRSNIVSSTPKNLQRVRFTTSRFWCPWIHKKKISYNSYEIGSKHKGTFFELTTQYLIVLMSMIF